MAHWLSPLLRNPSVRHGLWHLPSGQPLATRVWPAFDSPARRRGLLGRYRLESGEALVLAPCSSVHTAFMRFPIDIAFVDREGRITKMAPGVRPWRIRVGWRAFAVVELPSGTLGRLDCRLDDRLQLRTMV